MIFALQLLLQMLSFTWNKLPYVGHVDITWPAQSKKNCWVVST